MSLHKLRVKTRLPAPIKVILGIIVVSRDDGSRLELILYCACGKSCY